MGYRKRPRTEGIIIHCSANKHVDPEKATLGNAFRSVQRAHKGKLDAGVEGGIGYHGLIDARGVFYPGRPIDSMGAHAKGYNSTHLGLCLFGGIDKKGNASFRFSEAQFQTARLIIAGWRERYTIPGHNVIGHRDTGANKHCPCFDVKPWYVYGELWRSSAEEQRDFEAGVIRA